MAAIARNRKIIAAAALSSLLFLTGCAAGSGAEAPQIISLPVAARPGPGVVSAVSSGPVVAPGAAADMEAGSVAVIAGAVAAGGGGFAYEVSEAAAVPTNREIIVTGNVELAADDPVATSSQIASYVESIGGNVASRNEWRATPNSPGGASLSLRVPAGSLNSLIDHLANFGEVRSTWVNQWDVTEQAVDLDARINALQTSVTRLTQLMADAADTADLLNVERELSRRQADLDSLRASRADLAGRVQMSTLDLNIIPTASAVEVFQPHPGFLGGLERGWHALVSFARGFAVVIGAILPWLLALAVLGALLTPLVRWLRQRRRVQFRRVSQPEPDGPRIVLEQSRSAGLYHDDDD